MFIRLLLLMFFISSIFLPVFLFSESCAKIFHYIGNFSVYASNSSNFFFKYIYLFINFWLCWVFVAAHRLSLVAASKGYSSLLCAGFSLRWLLLSWSKGSRRVGFSSCGSRALERRLSSCGTWA